SASLRPHTSVAASAERKRRPKRRGRGSIIRSGHVYVSAPAVERLLSCTPFAVRTRFNSTSGQERRLPLLSTSTASRSHAVTFTPAPLSSRTSKRSPDRSFTDQWNRTGSEPEGRAAPTGGTGRSRRVRGER